MKLIKLLALLVLPILSYAQTEKIVRSQIEKVTVFTQGAEVSRTGNVSLQSGDNLLVFERLSPYLDENSLQFSGKGDYSILSLNFEIRYDESQQKEKIAGLNEQLDQLSTQVKEKKDLLAVSVSEENVLVSNTDFDSWQGMSVEQLEQGVNFVRKRLSEIKRQKQALRRDIEELNEQRQKLINELQSTRIAEARPNALVVVKIRSEKAQNLTATLSYVVADAGWEAYYDLRVDDISKPLQIDYKANVTQNTGEDWSDVKLTLSTGNPYDDERLPVLRPWYLNFSSNRYSRSAPLITRPARSGVTGLVSGIIIDANTAEAIPYANIVAKDQNGQVILGTTSAIDGRFNLNLKSPATMIEVSFLGYNKYAQTLSEDQFYTIRLNEASEQLEEVVIAYEAPRIKRSRRTEMAAEMDVRKMATNANGIGGAPAQSGDGGFKISQNPITLKFEVNTPYDIPSDGSQYKVTIKSFAQEVSYLYQAVPKLNEFAFLTASITGWEELNLMDGRAGVYYEGNYLGESELKVSEASDTLQVSLGKDKNVVVRRRTVAETTSKKLLSGKVEELFHYQIKVRNNKQSAIRLQITDQFPVSGNSEIVVEREESSGGKHDEESGLVNWDFTLDPASEKELDLIYKVRYPKKRTVNLY